MIIKELDSVLRLPAGIEAALAGLRALREMQKVAAMLRPFVAVRETIEALRELGQ